MVSTVDNAKQDELMELCRTHAARWGSIDELRAFCRLSECADSVAVATRAVSCATLDIVHYARHYNKWLGACFTVAAHVGNDGEFVKVYVDTYAGEVVAVCGDVRIACPVEVAPAVVRELKWRFNVCT